MPSASTRSSKNKSPAKSRNSLPSTSNESTTAVDSGTATLPRRSRIIAAAKKRSKSAKKSASRSASVSRSPSRSRISRKSTGKVFVKKDTTSTKETTKTSGTGKRAVAKRSERAGSTTSTASTTTRKKSTSKSRTSLDIDDINAQTRYSLRRRTPAPTTIVDPSSPSTPARSPSSSRSSSVKKCPIGIFNCNFLSSRAPQFLSRFSCPFTKCHTSSSSSNSKVKAFNSGYIKCTQCRFIQICLVTILLVAILALINYFHLIDALEYKHIKESLNSCYSTCSNKAIEAYTTCKDKLSVVGGVLTEFGSNLLKRSNKEATASSTSGNK